MIESGGVFVCLWVVCFFVVVVFRKPELSDCFRRMGGFE